MPKTIQPKKTCSYTDDFKVKAVKLSYQPNIQVKQVAEALDIHPFMFTHHIYYKNSEKFIGLRKQVGKHEVYILE